MKTNLFPRVVFHLNVNLFLNKIKKVQNEISEVYGTIASGDIPAILFINSFLSFYVKLFYVFGNKNYKHIDKSYN